MFREDFWEEEEKRLREEEERAKREGRRIHVQDGRRPQNGTSMGTGKRKKKKSVTGSISSKGTVESVSSKGSVASSTGNVKKAAKKKKSAEQAFSGV